MEQLGRSLCAYCLIPFVLATPSTGFARDEPNNTMVASFDSQGGAHLPATVVPLSSLSTAKSKGNLLEFVHTFSTLAESSATGPVQGKLDDIYRDGITKLRAFFPVRVSKGSMGGVDIIEVEPSQGVSPSNSKRVLINLRGGGLGGVSLLAGEMESIPIASLGAIEVITVGYRGAPERRYPSATADIVAVYKELLKTYANGNIGIYGCSDGAVLTAETVAWLYYHNVPLPGAVGMFGTGALVDRWGDSNYVNAALMGWQAPVFPPGNVKASYAYFSAPGLDLRNSLVSPIYSRKLMSSFPPSLLISGTRDLGLSSVVFTHAQLIDAGREASLHVWEGAPHCSFAQPVPDPRVPETRQAWNVIVNFFQTHLGVSKR